MDAYDAFVLGSTVYMGHWLDPARELVDRHGAVLADRQKPKTRATYTSVLRPACCPAGGTCRCKRSLMPTLWRGRRICGLWWASR